MPGTYETVYPRFKNNITSKELDEIYTPKKEEIQLAQSLSRGNVILCFILMLKSFQRLGYFTPLDKIPVQITNHISKVLQINFSKEEFIKYNKSGTRNRHIKIIRNHLNVKQFNSSAIKLITEIIHKHSKIKEEPLDLINIAIEELIRNRFELPAFKTLERAVNRILKLSQQEYFKNVFINIDDKLKKEIDSFFIIKENENISKWELLKREAGSPTVTNIRELVKHHSWLNNLNNGIQLLDNIPFVKIKNFANEAKAYNISKMNEIKESKRYTLALALIKVQTANVLDDIAEMFIKRMMKIHRKGKIALEDYRKKNVKMTDNLILKLRDLIIAYQNESNEKEQIKAIKSIIEKDENEILENCNLHVNYSQNNYYSFLWQYYKSHRSVLFEIIKNIEIKSTNQNYNLIDAIKFLILNTKRKSIWISTVIKEGDQNKLIDLSWVPNSWWKLITGNSLKREIPKEINRKYFELCLFTSIMWNFKSGNLYIEGSNIYSDYRTQLISLKEYESSLEEYSKEVNLSTNKKEFINNLKLLLNKSIRKTNRSLPDNEYVKIKKGELIISRLKKKELPKQKKYIEQLINEKLKPINILDLMTDLEYWIKWTKFFGLHSGYDTKLENPIERYILSTFCYGCNLGPTQATRSIENINRKNLSWINQMHITEEQIVKATNHIISAYNQFALPKFWGSGERASADGTKWDIYEQNLLSEYHIRYGGYGGIGYYHVSDKYIALFSHFIPCGVWEGTHILDILQNTELDMQPEIIHGDTQSQNAPVFGLAYLLGIKLMPRIRNWKSYTLYKSSENESYKHIENLFSDKINWDIIEKYLPDMLRVALSIKAAKITPSTILKKLGTYSRKNKLYLAFRELGRVVRTAYLMEYIRDFELRRKIQSATNKSEGFNGFAKWIFFGNNGVITENSRDKQRKSIKYNHLVANCLIFYNVCMLTQIIQELNDEGYIISKDIISSLSPYITHHINRYGKYKLNLERKPEEFKYDLNIKTNHEIK